MYSVAEKALIRWLSVAVLRYLTHMLKKQKLMDSVAEKAFISLQLNFSPPSTSAYLDLLIVQVKRKQAPN
jgi:hypothetical protein